MKNIVRKIMLENRIDLAIFRMNKIVAVHKNNTVEMFHQNRFNLFNSPLRGYVAKIERYFWDYFF